MILAVFAGIFLTAIFPEQRRTRPVPLGIWFIAAVTMLACLAACAFAFLRGSAADRVAAVVAALIDALLVFALLDSAL